MASRDETLGPTIQGQGTVGGETHRKVEILWFRPVSFVIESCPFPPYGSFYGPLLAPFAGEKS